MTESHLPGRCQRCWLRVSFCVCTSVTLVDFPTKVVIVRHILEERKSTGTARIAALALPNCAIVDYGDDWTVADAQLRAWPRPTLLFPNDDAVPVPPLPADVLVVLDGTWRQARRMRKKLTALHQAPCLALPPVEGAQLRLRDAPSSQARSTLEAIADAARVLGFVDAAEQLHGLHRLFVERTYAARGVLELKKARLILNR